MSGNKTLFILVFWIATAGLTFTSCFIFNINSKLVLVEIQEEEEGGCTDAEEDGDESSKTEKYFELITVNVSYDESTLYLFTDREKYKLRNGFYLSLIKPPLS